MPRSHNRKAHYTHTHIDYIPHKRKDAIPEKKRNSILSASIILCTVFGIGMAWFAAGNSVPALITGAVSGLLVGYYGGKQLDKSFDK